MPAPSTATYDPASMGREAAFIVLAAFEGERVVPAFVDGYVRQHGRRELKSSQMRNRELMIMLTRESLVAIAARMQAELPRRFAPRARGVQKPPSAEAAQATDAFLQAFIGAVAASLRWTPGDVADFAGDVALYGRMAAFAEQRVKPAPAVRGRASGVRAGAGAKGTPLYQRSRAMERPSGPFADRCAMLLDPSLMDKARTAAGELHNELEEVASRALAQVFKKK